LAFGIAIVSSGQRKRNRIFAVGAIQFGGEFFTTEAQKAQNLKVNGGKSHLLLLFAVNLINLPQN